MFEPAQHSRRSFLGMAVMTIAASESAMIGSAKTRLPVEGELPSLRGATSGLIRSHWPGRPARKGHPRRLLDLHLH